MTPSNRARANPSASLVLPFSLCTAGLLMWFWPFVSSGFRMIPGSYGDTLLVNYFMEHWLRWLGGEHPFWTAPFLFPLEGNMVRSELMLGLSPFYMFFRIVGLPSHASGAFWLVSLVTMEFAVNYRLFSRALSLSVSGCSLGAFTATFCVSKLCHFGAPHLTLLVVSLSALLVVEYTRRLAGMDARCSPSDHSGKRGLCVRDTRRRLLLPALSVLFVVQVHTSFNVAFIETLAFLSFLAWAASSRTRRILLRRAFASDGFAIAVSLLLLVAACIPLLVRYLILSGREGVRSLAVVELMLPRLQSWTYSPAGLFYGWQRLTWPYSQIPAAYVYEHAIGTGYFTTAILLWALLRRRMVPLISFCAIAVLLLVAATTWISPGVSIWRAVYELVPGARAFRAVARAGLLLTFPAGAAVALFADSISGRRGSRRVIAIGILGLALVEHGGSCINFDGRAFEARVSSVSERIDPEAGAFALALRADYPRHYEVHLDAMWASLETGVPTVNGYTGQLPSDWIELLWNTSVTSRSDSLAWSSAVVQWLAMNGRPGLPVQLVLISPRIER